jgi:hypothetical protein
MAGCLEAGTTDALAAALPAEEGASLLHVLPLLAANDAALSAVGARGAPQPSAFADARVPRASVAALRRADAASDGARGAALLACVCRDARAVVADKAASPLQREVAMQRARAVKAVVAALTRALATSTGSRAPGAQRRRVAVQGPTMLVVADTTNAHPVQACGGRDDYVLQCCS